MENPSSATTTSNPVKVVDSAPVVSTSVAGTPTPTPTPTPIANVTTTAPGQVYASFGRRLVALFLDQLILSSLTVIIIVPLFFILAMMGVVTSPSSGETNASLMIVSAVAQLFLIVVMVGYWVVLTGKKGQTIGKMIMKIKVVRIDNGEVPGYGGAFLREVIGKFISGLVFDLGYLWVLWDPKKEAWHDKITKTVVIKL